MRLPPACTPICSDLLPDPNGVSCYAHFNATPKMPSFVERDGKWHHLAVTWTAAGNGLTQVSMYEHFMTTSELYCTPGGGVDGGGQWAGVGMLLWACCVQMLRTRERT